MNRLARTLSSKLARAGLCAAILLLAACASSGDLHVDAAAESPAPAPQYCEALQTVLIAQPSLAGDDEDLRVSMRLYADAIEGLAEVSAADDALVLFEYAATAHLVAENLGDRLQVQRLGDQGASVTTLTLRAAQRCGLGS